MRPTPLTTIRDAHGDCIASALERGELDFRWHCPPGMYPSEVMDRLEAAACMRQSHVTIEMPDETCLEFTISTDFGD